MDQGSEKQRVHPAITKCLDHLEILQVDNKVKQVVYMHLESVFREGYQEGREDAVREMTEPANQVDMLP